MKELKTLAKQESSKIPSVRKKADKPWVLQRMWNSDADFKKYYFGKVPDTIPVHEWEDSFDKYMSPKHARQQIEKQLRTHFHGRFRAGRTWRIFNKTTGEVLLIDFTGTTVVIDETKPVVVKGAPKITFNPENKEVLTVAEMVGPAMQIKDQAMADQYLKDYTAFLIKDPAAKVQINSEEVAKMNLAYYAGYYDLETRERVERLFKCVHPVLGPVANKVTTDEVFNLGIQAGELSKGKVKE